MENLYVDNVEFLNKNYGRMNNYCSLRILQFNIRGMNNPNKFDSLKQFIDLYTGPIDVLVIGETWLKADRIQLFRLKGYSATFSCRDDMAGGGLAVYVRNGINAEVLTNINECGFHHIHVCLKLRSSAFDVHAVYRPPCFQQSLFNEKLEGICSCIKNDSSCVIVGDVNIPVNQTESRVVREYLDLLNCYNFAVTNTIPTRPASANILDHVVCSENTMGCVVNETMPWEISDHCAILSTFRLDHPIQLIQLQKTIVNHTRLNEAFLMAMQNPVGDSAREKMNYAVESYRTYKQRFSKVISINARVKGQCPWMSFDLWKLMRIKNNVLRRSRRRPDDVRLRELLAHISRKVQLEKHRSKSFYYTRLFENSNQKSVWRNLDQVLGRKQGINDCIKLTVDGDLTSHESTVADKLN